MISRMQNYILSIVTPVFNGEAWFDNGIRIQKVLPSESSLRTIVPLLLFKNGRMFVSFASKVPQFSQIARIQGLSK